MTTQTTIMVFFWCKLTIRDWSNLSVIGHKSTKD
jgi:hypothetical protein